MSRTDKPRLRFGGGGPPREFVNDFWTSRERQAVRIACLNAAKEHRENGIVDTIPSVRQHRHGAQWVWW